MTPLSTTPTAYNAATLIVTRRDADDNQRIERAEWSGPRAQFDRFDRNDDGSVSIEEIRSRLATLPAAELVDLEASLKASEHMALTAGVAGLGFVGALMSSVTASFGVVSTAVPMLAALVGSVALAAWVYQALKTGQVGFAEPKLKAVLARLAGEG